MYISKVILKNIRGFADLQFDLTRASSTPLSGPPASRPYSKKTGNDRRISHKEHRETQRCFVLFAFFAVPTPFE